MSGIVRGIVRSAALLFGLASCASAAAGQFYLFPLKEIEGVSSAGQAARPLVDQRVVKRLFGGSDGQLAQRAVIAHFVERLNQAYPGSLIHPKQVYDVNLGSGHRFVDDDNLQCKQAPSFNVADTYAVALGITRASVYEVVKGDNVELLVPVTLSLQFIRPSLAKVAYTLSETLYSPFRLNRREYEAGAFDGVIRAALVKNLTAQVGSLVDSARVGFNPKDVSVKLVARDGKFYVADQGVEAGFVKGEQVEARDAAGQASIFDVLYVDSGYAVLKPVAGTVAVGDSLRFMFETPADDSRKPRLMPVVSNGADSAWSSAVSDIFAKDIGFKASFQLSPVDVNFSQTRELVTRAANCVTWQKLPSMAEASGVRKDPPDYFLRFTPATTPMAMLSGSGGTKTSEMFHTMVTAQVVDQFGKVVYSELGENDYAIEKVDGKGLGFDQAREISLKNATRKLASNFVANVRFTPKDYRIAKVANGRVWAEGMGAIPLTEKLTFDILHPLDASVHGKRPMLDIEAGSGSGNPELDGELVGLAFSSANPALPQPQRGDLVRLYSQGAPGVTRVLDCDEPPYVGKDSIGDGAYLAPLVRHALYRSTKFASYIGDPLFYADTNALLQRGMFDIQLERPSMEMCSQPGYLIREEALHCENPQSCKATVLLGLVARLKKGTHVEKTFNAGLRTEFTGFPSAGKDSFYGYKELSNALSMQPDLLNKLNLN